MTDMGAGMAAAMQQQLLRLSSLQVVQRRVRLAEPAELGFIAVNETHNVLPFQQAALFRGHFVTHLSGAATVEAGAPYVAWLNRLCRALDEAGRGLGAVLAEDAPAALRGAWAEWLPAHALWCPLGSGLGGLLFARSEPWGEGDLVLAEALAGAFTQAFLLATMPRRRRRTRRWGWVRPVLVVALLGLLACTLLPVPETVLAPAEVVPDAPALLRAPFAGVVEGVAVAPNARVRAGQVLATLDRRQIATAYDVALKALEATRTEYRQVSQEAVGDAKARGRVALLQAKMDEQQADVDYNRAMLDRTSLAAPVDGIAVFNDPTEWIGKPVETGERIMLVAPPESGLVEAQVPAGSMIALAPGSEALFFDNLQPDHPASGRVAYAAYASAATVEGVLAYTVRIRLEGGAVRLGLRGTAKLYGPSRPFLLWTLRRPIATLRQWLTF